MEQRTHSRTSPRLVGEVRELAEGRAVVALATTPEMAVDDQGLVHGGFVFGAADYAAMLAVNDPNVVLGGAEVRFLKPVRAGDVVTASATITQRSGRKVVCEVDAECRGEQVLAGRMTAFVLDHHVLAPAK